MAATEREQRFQSWTSRLYIVSAFYAVVIASLPFWYKTTTIVRLPLPARDIELAESRLPCPVRIPFQLNLVLPPEIAPPAFPFVRAGDGGESYQSRRDWERAVVEDIERRLELAGDGIVTSRGGSDFATAVLPSENAACVDWSITLGSQNDVPLNGLSIQYQREVVETQTKAMLSLALPSDLTQIPGSVPVDKLASSLSSQLAELLQLPYGPSSSPALEKDKRSIPYARNVRLVISMMNEEASYRPSNEIEEAEAQGKGPAGVRRWNRVALDKVLTRRMGDLLTKLGSFYRFGLEVQTQWESPLGFEPRKIVQELVQETLEEEPVKVQEEEAATEDNDAHDEAIELPEPTSTSAIAMPPSPASAAKTRETSYLIDPEDLKIFVNSGEWSLSTTLSSRSSFPPNPFAALQLDGSSVVAANDTHFIDDEEERTLHFILYLPSPQHRPLRIAKDALSGEASKARGWLIPQWGGVVLHNLDGNLTADGRNLLASLPEEDLDEPFRLFERQLRVLLGLGASQSAGREVEDVLALEALGRRRLLESAREATQTLASIVRLVDKIENLGVGSDVQRDVDNALRYLSLTNATLSSQVLSPFGREKLAEALRQAHTSASYASRAFFNPNMIGQLYFPDEHKYAVYTPLFGPLAVPLLVSALRLVKERRQAKKRKEEVKKEKSQ